MRDKRQFVAVTGIGMICPLGITTSECWENMVKGKSGIRRITRFDPSDCITQIAGELPGSYYEMEREALPRRVFKRSILPSRLAILTARQAVRDAGLVESDLKGKEISVISGCGGSTFGDQMIFNDERHKRFVFSHEMLNALSACVSLEFGLKGPSFNVATACASGAFAVGLGYDYVIRSGELCIALGIDTMVHKDTIDGFNRLLALSENNEQPAKASRPFDKNRSGFVISEGACALILEPYANALDRGANIFALISGVANTSEAFNIIAPQPDGEGMARTMDMAIECSGISKEKIGYINAHGTSTPHNDRAETKAIKMVFGDRAKEIPVSSQKSMIGHSIGAAGAIEVGITALSLYHRILTPTINYEVPDPECDLDYVPNEARKMGQLHAAITNSFGFGGHNCCIVLENQNALNN